MVKVQGWVSRNPNRRGTRITAQGMTLKRAYRNLRIKAGSGRWLSGVRPVRKR